MALLCALVQTAALAADPDRVTLVPHGFISKPQVWSRFDIDYCWMGTYDETDKSDVRSIVHEQIELNSQYRFHDLGLCDNRRIVRLKIRAEDDRSSSLVGWLDAYLSLAANEPTMRLNLTFQKWDPRTNHPPGAQCKDIAYKSRCIKEIALHEFMHAVGFLHEHLRPEAESQDGDCLRNYPLIESERESEIKSYFAYFPASAAVPVADYDRDSWMNYCNPIYEKPAQISAGDLETLHALEAATATKIQTGR